MAQLSWPYVDQPTTNVEYSQLFRELRMSGINGGVQTNTLRPQGQGLGMATTIGAGSALVQGYFFINTASTTITHDAASPLLRIDRVVLRLDLSQAVANRVLLKIVKGIPGGGVPPLTQTETGIYELPIAQVTIPAGAISIGPTQVLDERVSTDLGIATWSTDRRPANPRRGQVGFNTTNDQFEWYTGSAWTASLPMSNVPNLPASKITSGVMSGNRVDVIGTSGNTTTLYSVPESPTTGHVLQAGPSYAGIIFNNAWKVRFDSTGTMDVGSIPAARVNSGVLDLARLPGIPGSKLSSAIGVDHVPNLPAGKVTSGAFEQGRIPNLPASRIISGTFNPDRIPGLDASKISSGYLSYNRLLNLEGGSDWAQLGQNKAGRIGGFNFRVTGGDNIGIYYEDIQLFGIEGFNNFPTFATIQAEGTYNITTSASANVAVSSGGVFRRSTSSRRYKKDERVARDLSAILDIQPKTWLAKEPYDADPEQRYFGAIAEDLHDAGLTELVQYDDQGRPDAIYESRVVYALLPVIKDLVTRVKSLEREIEELKPKE